MSRYDVEKFFPPPDPELICCICQCVLDSAKESPCRHVFCKVCIEQWLNEHNSCPTCRTWLSTQDLQNILPLVQNMINKLVMFCDYRNNGCEQKLMLEMYDAHIQKCEFKLLPCPNAGCNASLLRKDLSQHVSNTCEFREIVCTKGCRLKIPINDLNFHNCMIALKQKSEKQQKLIQEYWKKIQELVSLKDLLKKKVENLLHNIDHSTPVRGESMSNLFSYEEDEDITPISVIPRGEDNTDARLSIISNYFAFYANAVDRITSEVSQIEKEGNVVFNSEFSPVSNSNAFSLLQDDDFTPPNIENGQSRRQSDGISTPHNNLGGPMNESLENRERYPLPADSYSDINLDQEIPNNATEIDNEETGAEDHYNLTDRELDVSYVADSDDGGNDSPIEYSYDNISDNGIFESDEEEDDDDDFDDIPSDVSSSIQSSLVANVHSESAPDEAETPNEMRNLYEESGDLWSEHDYDNANQSTESVNVHPSNEALPEGDNADVNAGDGESYLRRSEEHYLSSDYISSPSVTSTQYSPVPSSPFHDSDSEMYENNVVMYSDLSDDETNRGILLVLDTEVTFASSTTEQVPHRTTSSSTENNNNNNTHSENSHVLSNDDDDDDDDSDANNNTDEDNDDCPSSPAENNGSNCDEEDPIVEDPHAVSVVQPAYSPPPIDNNVINHIQNTQLNDTSTVNICTSNNKSLATSYNNAIVGRVERPMQQLTMYQHRQRYIEMNSEPVSTPAQHNVTRFLQTGKESVRFSQQDSVAIAETDIPVSIKIEPDEEVEHIISSSNLATVQKTLMSTRTSYNSRVGPACQQVNSTGNDEAKILNERLMNISNRYTSSAQQTFNNTNTNWCAKRSNSSSTETRPLVKRRRTRDYSNYNSASQAVPMETVCNRVDLSVINVRESPCQLVPKCHRCSRFPPTVTTPAMSPSAIMTPPITTNSLPVSTTACTYSPRLMVNSGRQSLPSGGRTRQSRRRSIREWQASIQSDANDIRVVEERTALSGGSAMENTVGGGQTFRDRRHSHQPEYTVGQADSDDASYEPSDSYSDTDGQESDSSPEVLMPKSFFQLLEEYDSEETDASWTVDMD